VKLKLKGRNDDGSEKNTICFVSRAKVVETLPMDF